MKTKIFLVLPFLIIFTLCKKKEDTKDSNTNTTATTTTGSSNPPTVSPPKYAAKFKKNTTIPYTISIGLSAEFYDTKGQATKGGSVTLLPAVLEENTFSGGFSYYKSDNPNVGFEWKIKSIPGFPDTTFNVITDGMDTFQPETNRVYDKTKDFTISFPYMNWDTLEVNLGTVVKKITYTMNPVSVTFTSSDKVQIPTGGNTVFVTLNYKKTADINVRNRSWNFVYTLYNESFYKVQQ